MSFILFTNFNATSWREASGGKPPRGKPIPVRLRIPSYAKEAIHLLLSYTDYTHKQKGAVGGAGEGLESSEIAAFQSNPSRHHPLERRSSIVNFNATSWREASGGKPPRGKSIPVRMRILSYAKEAIYTHKQKGAVAGVEEGLEGDEIATFQPNPNRHHPLERRNAYVTSSFSKF